MSPLKALLILVILASAIGGGFYFLYQSRQVPVQNKVLERNQNQNTQGQQIQVKENTATSASEEEVKKEEMLDTLKGLDNKSATQGQTVNSSDQNNAASDQEIKTEEEKKDEMLKILQQLNSQQ